MNEDLNSRLILELKKFQNQSSDLSSFQKWISDNQSDLKPLISPGILIRLKRGDVQQAMNAIMTLLPACSNCQDIFKEGLFLTRYEYTVCTSQVTKATQSGTLTQIARPQWFFSNDKRQGADAYFKCNICDAVWTLVIPEREDNGLWERVA